MLTTQGGGTPLTLLVVAALAGCAAASFRQRLASDARCVELEHLVDEHSRDLAELTVRAEHANQSHARFLARISHELRSPLSAVIGYTDLVGSKTDNEQIRHWARRAQLAGFHLEDMIEDLIAVARNSELDSAPRLTIVRLDEFMAATGEMVEQSHDNLGITVDIGYLLAESYVMDDRRVRQILLNLLENAARHGKGAAVKLSATRCNNDNRAAHCIRFSVTDHGPGIPPEQHESIFEPFNRASDNTEGLGLGLAIAAQVAELLGSILTVQSQSGGPTSFSFEIRCDALAPTFAPIDSASPQVLVIDHNPLSRQSLAGTVSNAGYEAIVMASPGTALDLASQVKPVAVVVGGLAPGLTRAELGSKLRHHYSESTVLVSILSSKPRSVTEGVEPAFDVQLATPVSARELADALMEPVRQPSA